MPVALPLRAIIFDVDGTLAETEEAHRTAFNAAFAEAGRSWYWTRETYRALLQVTGGRQRIRHYLDLAGGDATDETIAAIHLRKNRLYAEQVAAGAVKLRPGILRLIEAARRRGVALAIATTTSRSNLDALLAQTMASDAAGWFDAIVAGEDVARKKPDPEVYHTTLALLGVPASQAVAIEDSRNGLLAASACGIATVVTPSFYAAGEDIAEARLVCPDLDRLPVTVDVLAGLLNDPGDNSSWAPSESAASRGGGIA